MRRVRFRNPAGSVQSGTWTDDGVHFGGRTYDIDEIDVLPPTDPSKIVCIGLNYVDHAHEVDMAIPDRPMIFLKPPNALAGHGNTITLPLGKNRVDYEAELGVVIGTQCKNVAEADAMDVVEGYTCVNDISNRDDQDVEQNWVRGKAFDNSAPVGPVIVPPEAVPDDANVRLYLNDDVKQDSSLSELIFSVPELIAEITQYMTLERGDVVITGTPPGVGPLSDGDTVAVDIEGIGTLRNEIRVD